jgi:hypothetical protein
MDSIYALRLARAVKAAKSGGDFIDHGWSILKCLHAEGFDIVPREPVNRADARKTLNEMAGLRAALDARRERETREEEGA